MECAATPRIGLCGHYDKRNVSPAPRSRTRRRPRPQVAVQCCFSTRNAGADQRVQSRIQELAPVRRWHPRIADRQAPPPAARLDQEVPTTCRCFPQRFLMLFSPSFQRILDRQKNGRFSDTSIKLQMYPCLPRRYAWMHQVHPSCICARALIRCPTAVVGSTGS